MKLDQIDLAFLHLAVSKQEGFDETDLAKSDLAYLGVGRTLDKLAYLKENKLIQISGKSFIITDIGKQILWSKDIPLHIRILKLLQIKSFEESDIVKYLIEPQSIIQNEIERLRKDGLLMFTTIKKDERITKVCEIMQEGLNHIQIQATDVKTQLQKLLAELSTKVQNSNEQKCKTVLEKLKIISTELD